MANQEHVKILKQGFEVWNQWREEHPDVEPDLSKANLVKTDLSGIYLAEANLMEANLNRANLLGAYLDKADLSGANLRAANLNRANLDNANLMEADLRGADLSKADLSGANLRADLRGANLRKANLVAAYIKKADLSGANLVEANLRRANLDNADLSKADLSRADLSRADLSWAWLSRANLVEANLNEANLYRADLRGANLSKASLFGTTLNQADLRNATITEVYLYGTARDDWIIDGIKCDYVYWDCDAKGKKQRTPKERDFRPGEFEELYKQLPTFDYFFKHSFTALDAVVMNRIVEAINEQHPEFELKLDSFHSRGQPHAKFTVLHKEVVEEARKQITDGYETRMKALEGRIDQMERFFSAFIEQPKVQQDVFINQLAIAEKGGLTMGDTTNIGRDSITISDNAHVENLTTGASFQGDHAQQLLQSTTPQSSKEDILKLLSFVQQELPKLPLPEEVKEEVANEVKGAEIQAKKEEPDKKKIGEKLQSATEALENVPKLTKAAITVGNLLGQAIVWCGMKWVEWKYRG